MENKQEIWKDIKGYEGLYQVSNLGRVKSLGRETSNEMGNLKFEERILKLVQPHKKYPVYYVRLYAESREYKQFKVNELVAQHFLNIPDKNYSREYYQVYFKDNNPKNFCVENLYYDISESAIRAFDAEGNFLDDFYDVGDASRKIGINNGNISSCLRGNVVHSSGFQFRKLKGIHVKSLPSIHTDRRADRCPIGKYWNDRLICVYNSITEAAEANLLEPAHVGAAEARGSKIKGFIFKKI